MKLALKYLCTMIGVSWLAIASMALVGCAPLAGLSQLGTAAPAPLARTTIDDRGLEKAWQAFDITLDALNLLGDYGIIVPGTPRGKAVATAIRRVNRAFAGAEHIAAGASSSQYTTALAEVDAALTDLRAAVQGSK